MSDSSNNHVHSIFKLLLIKQTFEKNKSLRAPPKKPDAILAYNYPLYLITD